MKIIDLRTRCLRCQKIPRGKLQLENYASYEPYCSFHCQSWHVVEGASERVASLRQREHTAGPDCWCGPEKDYVDPDTGVTVWVHREMQ